MQLINLYSQVRVATVLNEITVKVK